MGRRLVVVLAILAVVVAGWSFVGRDYFPSAGPTAAPGAVVAAGTWTYHVDVAGQDRVYGLHVPVGLATGGAVQLLIELHGGGGNGGSIDHLTGFYDIADRERFVVAAPSALNRNWNDGRTPVAAASGGADDVAFVSAMVDRIQTQVRVDPGRVYVTGISNGAFMAGRLACVPSDRIAAVAQVAGTAAVPVAAGCHPGRAVPVLEIHGTADPLVPYGGGTVAPQLGGRGQGVGVDAWAATWTAIDGDQPTPTISTVGEDTSVRTWHGATPRSDVVFYRVERAGHTWPGGPQYLPKLIIGSTTNSFDASEVIWTFLSSHRLE